jgi:hypothetical protein
MSLRRATRRAGVSHERRGSASSAALDCAPLAHVPADSAAQDRRPLPNPSGAAVMPEGRASLLAAADGGDGAVLRGNRFRREARNGIFCQAQQIAIRARFRSRGRPGGLLQRERSLVLPDHGDHRGATGRAKAGKSSGSMGLAWKQAPAEVERAFGVEFRQCGALLQLKGDQQNTCKHGARRSSSSCARSGSTLRAARPGRTR